MLSDPYELNYSKIKNYQFCPLLYKLVYIDNRRQPLTPLSSLGISIHRALEEFHRNGSSLDDLMDAYYQRWLSGGFVDAREQAEYYEKGRHMLMDYWGMEQERKSQVKELERRFEFKHGEWTIKGTIDRIDLHPDGTWEIIDYKTGPEQKPAAEAASGLQLGIYGLGAKLGLGIQPSKITFWSIFYAEKASVDYDPSKEDSILATFSSVGEKIVKKQFDPDKTRCPECGLRNTCPQSCAKDEDRGKDLFTQL